MAVKKKQLDICINWWFHKAWIVGFIQKIVLNYTFTYLDKATLKTSQVLESNQIMANYFDKSSSVYIT